jgi:type I restriction enzyme S subunit
VSAVLTAQEPSAKYLVNLQPPLVRHFDLIAQAPGGVTRLRELILTLAVQGKLVPQEPSDEPASELLKKIRTEKDRLIAEGKIKRDKPLAEISDEEKPFELPNSWQWVPLQHIGYTQTGTTPDKKNSHMYGGDIPFIKPGDIYPNYVDYSNEALSDAGLADSGRLAPAESLLMVCIGTIGKSNLIERECSFNQQINAVTPLCCSPEYVKFFCRSPFFQGEAWARSSSTTISILNKGKWEAIPVALPSLAEQSRIVTRVEELMQVCDALEASGQLEAQQHAQLVSTMLGMLTQSETPEALADNWQRIATQFDLLLDRPEAVDALEQTILQLAVRGLLVPQDPTDEPASVLLQKIRTEKDHLIAQGKIKRDKPLPPITDEQKPFELPQGWEWVHLRDVADNRLGKMLDKAKNTGKRYPYLRNTNVQWRHIDLDDIKEISLEANELDEFRLVPGDLLICEGGYPGRCAIWDHPEREMYFQKALHRVRPKAGIAAELIAISLEVDSKSGDLEAYFTGATIKHFVGQALDRYVFPLPPLNEQMRIISRVSELREICTVLRHRMIASNALQSQLADVFSMG